MFYGSISITISIAVVVSNVRVMSVNMLPPVWHTIAVSVVILWTCYYIYWLISACILLMVYKSIFARLASCVGIFLVKCFAYNTLVVVCQHWHISTNV